MLIVSDTSPLRYLIVIDLVELLPQLFGTIIIPPTVRRELQAPRSPLVVRQWIAQSPLWLMASVAPSNPPADATLATVIAGLDAGETEAILLARQLQAMSLGTGITAPITRTLLLIDDRDGRYAARQAGLEPVGTLGILKRASALGLTDLADALNRLSATNFRMTDALRQSLLADPNVGTDIPL